MVIRGGSAARAQFDRFTGEAGFEPRIRFETESYDLAQALVGPDTASQWSRSWRAAPATGAPTGLYDPRGPPHHPHPAPHP